MIYWNYIVVALCLLLLSFLMWKEVRRANKVWMVLRILASILAVAGLACMALPITISKQQKTDGLNEVVLLTKGFNKDSLGQFIKPKGNAISVYYLDESLKNQETAGAQFIADAAPIIHDDVNAVHVFGEGLDKEELKLLERVPVVFHPAGIGTGIRAINWSQQLKTGERLYVQGQFKNTSTSALKMILHGFDTNLDSINLSANSSQSFELSTIPKHARLAVYSVIVLSEKDTIERELIPIEVQPAVPLKFLLLSASPDFENKFLKNWLSENSYAVAIRTTISKNKYAKEFLNIPSFPLERINSTVLDKFDAIIADAVEIASLSKQEQGIIQNYIDQKGLGLIIKADSSLGSSTFYGRSFPIVQTTNLNEQVVKLHLADSSNHLPELSIIQPLYIRPQPGAQPLVHDQQSHAFVSNTIYGNGRVLVSTLANTYQWVLGGKNDAYTILWSTILNKAARKFPSKESWSILPAIPRINQPVQLQLETQTGGLPRGQVGEDFIYLEQSTRFPNQWNGTYWPAKTGWQAGIQTDGNTYWWYAYGNDDYKTITAVERMNNTLQYAAEHPYRQRKTSITTRTIEVEFPKVWFFILVLVCSGFLWAEKKFL